MRLLLIILCLILSIKMRGQNIETKTKISLQGWCSDKDIFRQSIYNGDTSYYLVDSLAQFILDYEVYFDPLLFRLNKKSFFKDDTIYVFEYWENGLPKSESKSTKNIWVYSKKWFSNGNVKMAGHNPNSLELQTVIQYRENGNVFVKSQQENHLIQGEFFSFYENGNPMEYGYYKDNLKIGKWIHYDETGKEDIVEIYEKGEVISTTEKE